MAIQKLNIPHKVDNAAKKKMVASNDIGKNETLIAEEVNLMVEKVNEIIDYQDESFIVKIDTIAQLRNYEGKEGQVVTLLGYYSKGDKDPLNYKWTTEQGIDDGGSIINTNNGSWLAVFSKDILIEDFGVSELATDNSERILNALKLGRKITCRPNKLYFVNATIEIDFDVNIDFDKYTVFQSEPDTTNGIKPLRIFNIFNTENVIIKGVFDGGYLKDGAPTAQPKSERTNNSSLITIRNCDNVNIDISIQNFATNWGSNDLNDFLSYGALYVRDCNSVICNNSNLTSSRIEGFIFLGNNYVEIKDFVADNNIGVWTPLHCFLNNEVNIYNTRLIQSPTSVGSTLNLYNNITIVENSYIENGSGIDFSFEAEIDISTYNILPVFLKIENNNIVNAGRILYSLYHSSEALKKNIFVKHNRHTFTTKTSTDNVTSLIRIDNAENVVIEGNISTNGFDMLSFFQSNGKISNVEIRKNTANVDCFVRISQANFPGWDISNILIEDNIGDILPLNGKSDVSTRGHSTFFYAENTVDNTYEDVIIKKNRSNAEGRCFYITTTSPALGMKNVRILENNNSPVNAGSRFVNIQRTEDLELIGNVCNNVTTAYVITSSVGKLKIENNTENSTVTKANSMFQRLEGSPSYFTFKNNLFNVPNPMTYGIINVQTDFSALKREVYGNTPPVSSLKTNVANTEYGITSNRPTGVVDIGHEYFDTTISKPLYYNGTDWVDANGDVL